MDQRVREFENSIQLRNHSRSLSGYNSKAKGKHELILTQSVSECSPFHWCRSIDGGSIIKEGGGACFERHSQKFSEKCQRLLRRAYSPVAGGEASPHER